MNRCIYIIFINSNTICLQWTDAFTLSSSVPTPFSHNELMHLHYLHQYQHHLPTISRCIYSWLYWENTPWEIVHLQSTPIKMRRDSLSFLSRPRLQRQFTDARVGAEQDRHKINCSTNNIVCSLKINSCQTEERVAELLGTFMTPKTMPESEQNTHDTVARYSVPLLQHCVLTINSFQTEESHGVFLEG